MDVRTRRFMDLSSSQRRRETGAYSVKVVVHRRPAPGLDSGWPLGLALGTMDVGVLLFAESRLARPMAQLVEGLGFWALLFADSQNLLPEVWGQLMLAASATSRIALG